MKSFVLFVLLMVVPFTFQIILYKYQLESFEHKHKYTSQLLKIMKEENLYHIVNVVFEGKIDCNYFQLLRLLACFALGNLMLFFRYQFPIVLILCLLLYKSMFYLLKNMYGHLIQNMSNEIPYFIKNVIYSCYDNPMVISISKTLDYADKSIKRDIEILIDDINNNPTGFEPYQNYIDKYEGKIKHLDYYLRTLYRISENSDDDFKLLDSLNETVSNDLNIVRQQKNKVVNDAIGYLGLIPVVVLVIFLTAMLIMAIGYL